jgi:hypothetical protein
MGFEDDGLDDLLPFNERRRPNTSPRETTVESRVCKFAKGRGWEHKKVGTNGWPDQMFLRRGTVLFIEFKRAKGGRLSEKQKRRIPWLRLNGFTVYTIDNFEDGKRVFESR